MSIRKRLIISNIAMVIIPIMLILIFEMLLGTLLIYGFHMNIDEKFTALFRSFRWIGLVLILVLTNGLLTYFVAKSILLPIDSLTKSAQRIREGDLDSPVQATRPDELGHLAESFELMRIKLKESAEIQAKYEQNRKELIANISHDLKTPITSIKGYVEGICTSYGFFLLTIG